MRISCAVFSSTYSSIQSLIPLCVSWAWAAVAATPVPMAQVVDEQALGLALSQAERGPLRAVDIGAKG